MEKENLVTKLANTFISSNNISRLEYTEEETDENWSEQFSDYRLSSHSTTMSKKNVYNNNVCPMRFRQVGSERCPILRKIETGEVDWMTEFETAKADSLRNTSTEEEDLKNAAQNLLSSIDRTDNNLNNSQFVSFIEKLAEVKNQGSDMKCPFSNNYFETSNGGEVLPSSHTKWAEMYQENISHLVEDSSWQEQEKLWEKYKARGFGYENFYQDYYKTYEYSYPLSELGGNLYETGLYLFLNNNLTEALRYFEHEVHRNSGNVEAWKLIGQIHAKFDNSFASISAFVQAEKLSPTDCSFLVDLSNELLNEGCTVDYLHTLNKFSGKLESEFDDLNSYAREILGRLLKRKEQTINSQKAIASLYNFLGEFVKSSNYLSNPSDEVTLNALGVSFAGQGKHNEAIKQYSLAIDRCPQYCRARFNLARSLLWTGKNQEAAIQVIALIQQTTKLAKKDDSEYWCLLEIIVEKMGNAELIDLVTDKKLEEIGNLISF